MMDVMSSLASNRARVLIAGLAFALVAIVGLAWWLGFLTAEPEPVSITEAAATVTEEVGTDADASSADEPASEALAADRMDEELPAIAGATIDSIDGEWSVVTSDATFVGYRADSQVGEAVGRSPGVTGSLSAEVNQITDVTIVADMTQLESDSSVRDGHLGDEGIEHNTYPTSTFVLSEPITVEAIPLEGEETSFSAVGDLTVRDITLPVTIELDALVVDDRFIVAGSTFIDLDDYGASVSSTNEATMEFSIVFAR